MKRHFKDVDNLKLNRITVAKVEKFITARQKNGMNITTLRKIIVTFNQVMNYAVRHKYIDHNPVRDAERPRGQGKEDDQAIHVLNPEQINSFLSQVKVKMFLILFKLAIMSGARQGELLGLRWPEVDWSTKQIHIKRTFNNGAWYKPKSKASKRKIDLGPVMMSELKKWKLACPPSKLDLVFPNSQGRAMNHGNMLRRHFWPAIKAAGCPKIRFHDLRHTYASFLIEQGENIKYIQSQLGHSSPMVTLTIYAHLLNPVNQEAACRLEKAILEPTGHNSVTTTKKGATKKIVTP